MLNLTSDLVECVAESKFTWTVKNFKGINWGQRYVIRSEEIDFKEANSTWTLTLTPFTYNSNKIFLVSKFFVKQYKLDENAKYNFDIILNDGSMLSSLVFGCKNGEVECELPKYIPLNESESIQITPRVTLTTLRLKEPPKEEEEESEVEESAAPTPEPSQTSSDPTPEVEDDYDHLSDAEKEQLKDSEECCEKCCDLISDTDEEGSVGKSIGFEKKKNDEKKETKIGNMDDFELTKVITDIYIENMRQVADTSAALLVSAARNEHKVLLSECISSLASQLNSTNFTQIWEVAKRLELKTLQSQVIEFVINNRDKIRYDEKISPELMLQIVRAFDKQ